MDYEPLKDIMRYFYKSGAIFTRNFSYPGYTFNEALVLDIVDRHPGIIARDISEYTAIDSGYLSKILKKLENNKMITRKSAKCPPFEKMLHVTKKGKDTAAELEAIVDKSIEENISVLDPAQKEVFFKTVLKFNEELKKIIPDTINYAIFLRIVAKFVKVPFYVQHFKSESLEYLVSARYPLCISTKHSWTTEARSSSSSCAPASISSSMTRSQPR